MSENTNNKKEDLAKLTEDEVTTVTEKVEDVVVEEAVAEVPAEEPTVEDIVEEPAVEVKPVITAPVPTPKPGLGFVGNGAMGVATFKEEKKPVAKKAEKKKETVAIHSTRNVTWAEVGKVYIGYNIVTKEAADKWLTRDHTRLATPEEVAQEFGN